MSITFNQSYSGEYVFELDLFFDLEQDRDKVSSLIIETDEDEYRGIERCIFLALKTSYNKGVDKGSFQFLVPVTIKTATDVEELVSNMFIATVYFPSWKESISVLDGARCPKIDLNTVHWFKGYEQEKILTGKNLLILTIHF